MKPMSIKTEFTFSINRDFINVITDSFEGGMFENLDIKYGKKGGHVALKNCHVVYSLANTIQSVKIANITTEYINKIQRRHKDIFFSRIAEAKKQIMHIVVGQIKIKTMVSFVDEITIQN